MKLSSKIPLGLVLGVILLLLLMQQLQIGRLWLRLGQNSQLMIELNKKVDSK